MKAVGLNADLAEGFEHDLDLMEVVTEVNLCLGCHAGNLALTRDRFHLACDRGLKVGLHPGYPDRARMGRAVLDLQMELNWHDAHESLRAQCLAGLEIGAFEYLKPHGAFYSQSADEPSAAELLERLLVETKLPLVGLSGTLHSQTASAAGVPFHAEGFADRRLGEKGRLLPRSNSGAIIEEPESAAEQALFLAPTVSTICVHGDTKDCVDIARAVRAALSVHGYHVGR
ncbi:MAG: LamB/YcsF family protein [Armatimonadetes bacterium]|nr:LamB/YcsF family protein [Armatimonadota bacterium]